MRQFKLIVLVLLSLFFCKQLLADTVYLKNGHKLEGIIQKNDSSGVVVEVSGGAVSFSRKEIESISALSGSENDLIRQKWETKKAAASKGNNFEVYQRGKTSNVTTQENDIEFESGKSGIILDVRLNNKVDTKLILDTGASVVMLRKNVAGELGFDLDTLKPNARVTLADGRSVFARRIVLESVQVQDSEAKNVEATIVLDEAGSIGKADGLLGMSFLKNFNVKIDSENKKLILEKL